MRFCSLVKPPRVLRGRPLTHELHAFRCANGADHALAKDRMGIDDDDADRFASLPVAPLADPEACDDGQVLV